LLIIIIINGRCTKEIKRKTGMMKEAFNKGKELLSGSLGLNW